MINLLLLGENYINFQTYVIVIEINLILIVRRDRRRRTNINISRSQIPKVDGNKGLDSVRFEI